MRLPVLTFIATYLLAPFAARAQNPNFNQEVRPILSQHCFKCHGPDDGQRMAGLRLDRREGAIALLATKERAITPFKPALSTLVKRVLSNGADRMPPAYANKPLSDKEKETLRRWVAAGAEYKPHWAFVAPIQAPLPKVGLASWPRNPIDAFVLARMEKAGLKPSLPADRYTLIRRLSLDLLGLPPTPEEADAFVHDTRPDAYGRLVDRLLASPHYGERWARRWLDLARYADTNGYEKDRPRSVWPYRDWVIDALNHDMPYNEFTVEQLAGDMLPNATLEQRIATGFHRNTMLNEEGGIDPQEYQFYSMVDRVATTGTTWLGLTTGCAQCHTHKFDPITHKDYYSLMAFLNNTEDRTLDVVTPDIEAKRAKIQKEITAREGRLADAFPAEESTSWSPAPTPKVTTASGARAEILPDNSVRISGTDLEKDIYTVDLDSAAGDIGAVRLETLPDPSLGHNGPGRTPHGNFVLSKFTATLTVNGAAIPVHFMRAEADFSQDNFPAQNALGGNPASGWAIAGTGAWNVARTITFYLDKPVHLAGNGKWSFVLDQSYGGHHTIGRFRISLGQVASNTGSLEVRRKANLDRKYAAWLKQAQLQAVHWRTLRPVKATSNLPLLTTQGDNSVFVSGDESKRDLYDLDFQGDGKPITAVRLEALPDDRLPAHGPGRVFYEGAPGDFFLSEITLTAPGKVAVFASATQSGGGQAKDAIDGNPQTAWNINGRQGTATQAVFRLAAPLTADAFSIHLLFERYHAADLGRFRIAVTEDPRPAVADFPPTVEEALVLPAEQRTQAQKDLLLQHFLSVAPELQGERDAIAALRNQMPAYPTALAFTERPANNPRLTYVHNRGEYLQTKEKVTPGIMAVLPPLPAGAPPNRLTFARWLVAPNNPLVARVAVNRQWAAFFGRGIVRTTQDFGYQGDPPTNPELLDWLAVEFVRQGWSFKKIDRLIVMSATYQQSSHVTPALLEKDPEDRLLTRAPRVRLEAELVRDTVLAEGGLLSAKIGGPSVFPPQPPGITSEGTYGPLEWRVSEGEDRYRRGLYTFSKRTAPYAMFATFDAPSGEACVARRDVSNTPLQALTMLNNEVLIDAARAMGRMIAARPGSDADRMTYLFRRCLTRPPAPDEMEMMQKFYAAQKVRFEKRELDPATVAGPGDGDVTARAAWTTLARTLLNVDEGINKQ